MIRFAAAFSVLSICLLGACARTPRAEGARPPADFSLSLTLSSGTGASEPAWYILQPDGTLRAARGAAGRESARPLPVRLLTRAEFDRVWELTQAAGLAAQPAPGQAWSDDDPDAADGGAVYYLAAEGRGRTRRVPGPAENPALANLAAELHRLAWLDDR